MSENVNSGYAYVTRDGDVLDLLCLRVYRRDGMMDAVKSANPHLHAVGVVYSAGIRIWFPPVDADEQSMDNGHSEGVVNASSIRLWG